MADQTLVIVESPAKAKTINKYLGRDFTVLASFGHVRDLPAKDGSVRPEEDFAMDWELADRGKSRMDEIARAAKDASRVLLATDPDREGEAISWHVQQLLRDRRGLKDLDIRRVTFNEITKSAILDAVAHPRDLDRELIEAYLARRALDYLVGFTLSPVLWRKLPGSRSAGRVQSVALRLICERELEIERFRPREFWSIEAVFRTPKGDEFTARLTHLNGRKLDKFDLPDEASARAAVAAIDPLAFAVVSVETKQVRRHPAPPFTTSTLQQEASRKLGMSATQTMRTAQRLYEGVDIGGETVGLITYMRTDGLTLAGEAIAQARQAIGNLYGPTYVPGQPRVYKSTAKNAQEAHEAIRPTDLRRRPEDVSRFLSREELRLYELIWKRTMACQMESAVLDQAIVDVADARQTAVFRAVGTVVRFDGFLKVYQEDRDDPAAPGEDADESQRRLPAMAKGDAVDRRKTIPEQHFTQPPPRYTEASLVKRMEELGIGRPSTYASILQVLQDREYVRLEKKRFVPEDRGRIVTAFLENFFRRYVEYDFTAKLEEQLDDISGGRLDWKQVLRDFWAAFHAAVEETKDLKIGDVISALDEALSDHLFPPKGDGTDPRLCPSCAKGRLGLKLGRTGAFVGCSNYPECRFTRPLGAPTEENGGAEESAFPRLLGEDPETGLPVSIRKGPYGIYAQLGPKDEAAKGEKPKRASLTKSQDPMTIGLEEALALLSLPREIGRHPESGEPIVAGIGRFGPYLKHGERYKNLPPDEDVLKIGMNRAVDLLAADAAKARPSAEPLREVGAHPQDGEPIKVFAGRYGPYVRHGKVMASLPRGVEPEAVTVDKAVEWLAAKAAKGPAKGGPKSARGGRSSAKAAPKSATKKPPAKKAAARKGKAAE
ncbi:type I DNA topoisomerase [Inquilinus sp. Marseille-Q2685]|uniref:type I DNA topoisomerase n=1 Tax=Inquilinus sp. Marseille-Q2685 TaxID=2866581 RepID=UPI001CE47D5D|nr:type I DNA topoisomerase [Inquilinus sp. Marseille-Q2685]